VTGATEAAYDAAGSAYQHWRWSRLWDTLEVDVVLEELPTQGRALDAGCGYGRYAAPVRVRGLDYVGIDISDVQLGLARAAHPEIAGQLVRGDIVVMPFADASFDAVLCTRVLSHGASLDAASGEFARVLRPGGTLVVTDISDQHYYERATIPTESGEVRLPVKRYAQRDLAAALERTGLAIERCRRIAEQYATVPLLDVTVARKLAAR